MSMIKKSKRKKDVYEYAGAVFKVERGKFPEVEVYDNRAGEVTIYIEGREVDCGDIEGIVTDLVESIIVKKKLKKVI